MESVESERLRRFIKALLAHDGQGRLQDLVIKQLPGPIAHSLEAVSCTHAFGRRCANKTAAALDEALCHEPALGAAGSD